MLMRWRGSRWLHITLGLVAGAAAGLAVYLASRLTGPALFALCGTTAGGVAALVVSAYSRFFQLAEVTVAVPQFSELRFVVTRDNKQTAWRLFVEAVTRVSGQPLGTGTGLVREALTSLYQLFGITREVLSQAAPTIRTTGRPTVEHLGIAMLNNELRPFLSRWHPRLRAWEQAHPDEPESSWPDDAQCRAELEAMQLRLLRYVEGLGELAQVPNVEDVMRGILADAPAVPGQPIRRSAVTDL
ncbi:hypothetical protein O7634_26765 [Micromonospora sp. WMMD1120]|uniref:hypothetical protein n=1 Tax=Micromonospora sp. WMMD1120 TaxID=3016106 RepID=UPI002416209C|nr:hypothetical protein [Micromonospora sp. WMMD1120]MDG4810372.1 hypothetical protein [Micromonospora sp. WMMD1120]